MPSDPFVGQICMSGFNFAPNKHAFCAGQILPISQNTALFSLLGTTYGGDGSSTFGLPDLQGRVPIGQGQGPGLSDRYMGDIGGAESVTLISNEMPSHRHNLMAVDQLGDTAEPSGHMRANTATLDKDYITTANNATVMHPSSIAANGGDQAHSNMPPYLVVNYFIALYGVFPPRG